MSELVFDVEIESSVVDVEIVAPTVDVEVTETVVAVITVEGPAGQPGPPGAGVMVYMGALTGAKDSGNTTYTTGFAFQPGTVRVYLNGLRERYVTATAPNTVTFQDPPSAADDIWADYLRT